MAISQGAASSVDAMTEPRPRLTNRIGNVQQTSVVNDDASANTVKMRGRMIPSPVYVVSGFSRTCREHTTTNEAGNQISSE
jgi:hypothetical protein